MLLDAVEYRLYALATPLLVEVRPSTKEMKEFRVRCEYSVNVEEYKYAVSYRSLVIDR